LRKPGKFSTSVVVVSAPPTKMALPKRSGLNSGAGGVEGGGESGAAGVDDDDLAYAGVGH
jgi:hypothetical protein